MSKELFAKIGRGLFPADERGEELLHGMKEGKAVMVTIDKPRNPLQHKLYWALIQILLDNCEEFEGWDREEVSDQIKFDCHAFHWYVHSQTGVRFGKPQSIAWESMTQDKFNRLFTRVVYVVTTQYLPGVSSDEIRAQVEEMVDGNRNARR